MSGNDLDMKVSDSEETMAHLAAIVDSCEDAVISRRPDGTIISWNKAAERLYGYSREEAVGRHISMLVPPDRLPELEEFNLNIERGGGIGNFETKRRAKDGSELHVSLTMSPIRGKDGTVSGIAIIARDITERVRIEHLLRESETRYRVLVEMAPDGFFVHQDGRFVYANCTALGIFGIPTLQELQRHTLLELLRPEDRDKVRASIEALLGGGPASLVEYRVIRPGGGEVSVETSSTLVDFQGTVSVQVIARDVTERKRSEREREDMLKELDYQRNRFETVVREIPVGVIMAEAPSGKLVYQNEESLRIFRADIGRVEGFSDYGRWHAYRADGTRMPVEEYPLVRALKKGETVIGAELKILRGDGTPGYICLNAVPIRNADGEIVSGLVAFSDITQNKEAEAALLQSALHFQRMADAMPQIVWTAQPDGTIDYFNAHFEGYTGMRRPESCGLDAAAQLIAELIHPEDREATEAAWRKSIATGETYQQECRIKRNDGGYRWHLSRAIAERDGQGMVTKWYGTATDIHELRETKEKLQASEARFRWLFESNLIAIFFWKEDGSITDANEAYCELIGYTAEECRAGGLNWLQLTDRQFHGRDFAAIEEMVSRGICRAYEKELVNQKTGEKVAVLTAIASMVDHLAEGIGFAVDLTDLKRAEEALRKSEATLKLAIETTGLGIFELDLVTGKGEWSAIGKQHYGLPPEGQLDLQSVLNATYPEDRPLIQRIAREAATPGGAETYSAEYRTVGIADGLLRWISMRARVSYDENGKPARLVGACLNVTDTVRAQEALRDEMTERLRTVEELRHKERLLIRQGRLAAMGEMIANIAHQWRQPLNTLGLIIQELPTCMQRGILTAEYLDGSVGRAMQVIGYMSQTIDGFRNFFGPDKEKQDFAAAEVLEQTVAILDAAFTELKLQLEVHADPDATIYGTPNEYAQVILNLLMNAKDALLERGVPEPKVVVRLFRERGRAVLTVADNAGGIAPEIFDKIFDPYFTTKGPDKGTGIGLFMSKTIIEKSMGGTLTVRNTARGAEFRVEV